MNETIEINVDAARERFSEYLEKLADRRRGTRSRVGTPHGLSHDLVDTAELLICSAVAVDEDGYNGSITISFMESSGVLLLRLDQVPAAVKHLKKAGVFQQDFKNPSRHVFATDLRVSEGDDEAERFVERLHITASNRLGDWDALNSETREPTKWELYARQQFHRFKRNGGSDVQLLLEAVYQLLVEGSLLSNMNVDRKLEELKRQQRADEHRNPTPLNPVPREVKSIPVKRVPTPVRSPFGEPAAEEELPFGEAGVWVGSEAGVNPAVEAIFSAIDEDAELPDWLLV